MDYNGKFYKLEQSFLKDIKGLFDECVNDIKRMSSNFKNNISYETSIQWNDGDCYFWIINSDIYFSDLIDTPRKINIHLYDNQIGLYTISIPLEKEYEDNVHFHFSTLDNFKKNKDNLRNLMLSSKEIKINSCKFNNYYENRNHILYMTLMIESFKNEIFNKCENCKHFTWACPNYMCMNPKHPDFEENSDYPIFVTGSDTCNLFEEKTNY